jgi:hypothetical protein
MSISNAVEAGARAIRNLCDGGIQEARLLSRKALNAALPHLAPQPSQSDEEAVQRVRAQARDYGTAFIEDIDAALAAVRAEEREACAKVLDERAAELRKQKLLLSDVQAERLERSADAIRARKS